VTARREGGNELDLEFNEVSFAIARRGKMSLLASPAKAYHGQGWWLYCNNCETQLYEDAEDDDGNPLTITYAGRHAFCD
jgi:hypothetical protein